MAVSSGLGARDARRRAVLLCLCVGVQGPNKAVIATNSEGCHYRGKCHSPTPLSPSPAWQGYPSFLAVRVGVRGALRLCTGQDQGSSGVPLLFEGSSLKPEVQNRIQGALTSGMKQNPGRCDLCLLL